ncbi:F-box protein SKIP27-like [Impatiens glandulifera]|uniref:F-box protein SKIP27-like n=1 Tax=Impatiens glandulifera TaxID=253017 RepID=UPI001FB0F327|nr:F-box protein SKIP27-like [Impatiens glandulifera]
MKRTSEKGFMGVRLSRSISGGKRVSLFLDDGADEVSTTTTTLKRQCSEKFIINPTMSLLETLPQDLLIRVLCRVDHDDLKQLVLVSKPVREASLVAKKWHFEYSTPKKIAAFRNSMDLDGGGGDDDDDVSSCEIEAPNAPRQIRRRIRSCLSGRKKKLGDISVALFTSSSSEEDEEEEDARWPRKQL